MKAAEMVQGQTWTVDVTPNDSYGDGVTKSASAQTPSTTQYNLVISVLGEHGSTDPSPGTHPYFEGSIVSVTALPNSGYQFDHWTLDGINAGSANPIQVNINSNHNLVATFTELARELTVTSPNGGEEWVSGTTHTIKWTSTGSPTAYVKIELVKPGALNKVIISSTPNDGSYDWLIPLTQALGSDYRVKVTRTTYPAGGSAATDSSDAYFALIPETLTVASPNNGEEWIGGTTHTITWTSTGSPTAFVKIELVKLGVALNKVIIASTPNDGSFDWVIPLTQSLGSDYMVKVTRTTYPTGSIRGHRHEQRVLLR